jgi:polyhydroxyalkanoate depolymerase
MTDNLMSRFPCTVNQLETLKIPVQTSVDLLDHAMRSLSLSFDLNSSFHKFGWQQSRRWRRLMGESLPQFYSPFTDLHFDAVQNFSAVLKNLLMAHLKQLQREKNGELEFINLFTEPLPDQDWSEDYDDSRILLDLPGLRVIDISSETNHALHNYTAVFAPRAGHHSNIAEKVALYLRGQGLTRMALVEQKCADDIPLYVSDRRHQENFDSQVAQYRRVLADLKKRSGHPSHLVAICQPGPLLMSTLILHPELGKTFGSAGSPMHTEAEEGFLTDFARLMGEDYIDNLIRFFGHATQAPKAGSGRQCFDGALQVLGFYYLGMDQHVRNFKRLLRDLKRDNRESARRQMAFYRWYHTVHHFPAGFIRDTFKKIFINNELIRGRLVVGEKRVGIDDYPGDVPIWALGGNRDEIAPPLQATGHMDLISAVPAEDKLDLICNGGHMGLFRSEAILKAHYSRIARFMMDRSDRVFDA